MAENNQNDSWTWRLWLVLCLFLSGGLWGITPSLAKFVIADGGHPLGLTLWQGIAGGLLLAAITIGRGKSIRLSKWHLSFYSVCGITGTALPTFIMFAAAAHITAGVLAMVIALVPLMTYLGALCLRIERAALIRMLGVTLGFAAVCLIVFRSGAMDGDSVVAWALLALLIPLSYTLENFILALKRPPISDELSLLAGMLLMSAVALGPVVAFTGTWVPMSFPWGQVEWCIVLIVLINVLSYSFFLYVVRVAGPVFAAQAGYLTVVCGVISGMVIWNERYPPVVWLAAALMIAGLALVRDKPVTTR